MSAGSTAHGRSFATSLLSRTLYVIAIGALLTQTNFLGFSSVSSKWSQNLVNQIFGGFYPDTGQREITVALITPELLAKAGESWPASYEFHAQMLESILAYEPRALYIDFWFRDERADPTIEDLAAVLEDFKEDIPIYASGHPDLPGGGIRPDLSPHLRPVAPLRIVDQQDFTARSYELLQTRTLGKTQPLHEPRPTLALQIYEEVWRPSLDPDAVPRKGDELAEHYSDVMEVMWGMRSSRANAASLDCTFAQSFFEAFWTRVNGSESAFRSRCPYSATVLVEVVAYNSSVPGLRELLEDKIVMYAIASPFVGAWINPPTHESMASVYRHAMALDNLITFGDDYVRRPTAGTRLAGWNHAVNFFVLALVAIVNALYANRNELAAIAPVSDEARDFVASRRMGLATFVFLMGSKLTIAWVCFSWFDLAPINWVGFLAIEWLTFSGPFDAHLSGMSWLRKRLSRSRRNGNDSSGERDDSTEDPNIEVREGTS